MHIICEILLADLKLSAPDKYCKLKGQWHGQTHSRNLCSS